ncbi:SMP-30/Gluconolactonase/LRE-like region [Parasponia andersonii]|uniref:SMP-30/Gluconolactonase/LRE-like region n=1 Tax=Parasponia andersonii TaxID=3476 RepID=A0A2P5DZN9_PARAD|nr:SMP-30/Gluconolactonase/LRE-like region [Parasponia andersonii]
MSLRLIPSNSSPLLSIFFLLMLLGHAPTQIQARKPHVINFRSPNLYPEGITWDPSAQHFIVGSVRDRTLVSVSDAGVAETLISDPDLPENVTFLGLAIDASNNRLLAAVHADEPLPPFDALAAYDLRTRRRVFLSLLPSDGGGGDATRQVANAVAVDFKGNAYVTNSAGNFIWKVNERGEASIFSKSPAFTAHPVDRDSPYSFCSLNGIAYLSKGYLLVVQSNTGKMFKVSEDDGTARLVLLDQDLPLADGIAVRGDGVVLVNSMKKFWVLKSQDSWGEGVVYDEIDLEEERFPTSITVGNDERVYVIYGHALEAMMGNSGREIFGIVEVRSEKENREESVWIFVLVGLGLAYFLFWRFQMRRLITNLDKKTT